MNASHHYCQQVLEFFFKLIKLNDALHIIFFASFLSIVFNHRLLKTHYRCKSTCQFLYFTSYILEAAFNLLKFFNSFIFLTIIHQLIAKIHSPTVVLLVL